MPIRSDLHRIPPELVLGTRMKDRVPAADQKRQREEVKAILARLRRQPGVILADEVGMGKTFVALAIAYSVATPTWSTCSSASACIRPTGLSNSPRGCGSRCSPMTPFGQTLVRTTTIPHHTECGPATTAHNARLPSISYAQLDDLRQRLWNFPAHIDTGERSEMPLGLFMKQLMRPQIGFQRGFNRAFVREAALLAEHGEDHPLRAFFRHRTGFDLLDFIDLSFALCARIFEGERDFTDAYLCSLHGTYTPEVVSAFLSSISRTTAGLTEFCRSLPDADDKVASEFFEFPVLARYPFFRRGNAMFLWHRALFFRGLEGFVHSVLSEQGDQYMQRFGRLFERHVTAEARKVPGRFLDEDALVELIAAETKVPDGLLSFPGCNVFIESKAGLFHESVMAVGNSTMFARKTRAIRTAVRQARATSVSLRRQRRAPREVLEANANYLLVVTNKDLGASRGTALQSMYPAGTLDCPDPEGENLEQGKNATTNASRGA